MVGSFYGVKPSLAEDILRNTYLSYQEHNLYIVKKTSITRPTGVHSKGTIIDLSNPLIDGLVEPSEPLSIKFIVKVTIEQRNVLVTSVSSWRSISKTKSVITGM
jgi:hypothetical protein